MHITMYTPPGIKQAHDSPGYRQPLSSNSHTPRLGVEQDVRDGEYDDDDHRDTHMTDGGYDRVLGRSAGFDLTGRGSGPGG